MTVGQKIRGVRKFKKMTIEELASAVGVSTSVIWKIENDQLKGGPDPETVVKIVDALNSNEILYTYLEANPVYKAIIPRIFPDLNNIRREPAIIYGRLANEMEEARDAARILEEIFSNAEPENTPNFKEVFKAKMEQIVDVMRGSELLFLELISAGVMTDDDRREIHARQQQKCIDHGHHKPDNPEAA